MAGKGDKLRKGANLKAYGDGYDRIFTKRKTIKEWQLHFRDVSVDFNGFKEFNSDDLLTESQYKTSRSRCTAPTIAQATT